MGTQQNFLLMSDVWFVSSSTIYCSHSQGNKWLAHLLHHSVWIDFVSRTFHPRHSMVYRNRTALSIGTACSMVSLTLAFRIELQQNSYRCSQQPITQLMPPLNPQLHLHYFKRVSKRQEIYFTFFYYLFACVIFFS